MTTAFVLDNETILCQRTLTGWLPIQVALPDHQSVTTDEHQSYRLGYVELFASIDPSQCATLNTIDTLSTPSTIAITYHYAKNNNIALPIISDNRDTIANSVVIENDSDIISFISYRQLITQLPSTLAAQLSQAMQLLRWQADTQFCSRCSSAVNHAKLGERAMVCPVCHLHQYPRVQPCVITAITRPTPQTGEMQILLAHHHRYGKQTPPLQYGLIAGFVEVGESLEHAVVREVSEEVGLSLTDIRYVSSQPWPFPSNLMLGFQASYASGEIVLQEDELSHADFFDISNLPKIPFKGSIAYDLIAQIVSEQGMTL